jgi:hypothetical protein
MVSLIEAALSDESDSDDEDYGPWGPDVSGPDPEDLQVIASSKQLESLAAELEEEVESKPKRLTQAQVFIQGTLEHGSFAERSGLHAALTGEENAETLNDLKSMRTLYAK